MVIIVDAGAVAEARAARTTEKAKSSLSTKNEAINTNTDAAQASSTVITKTFAPLPLRAFNLKNWLVLNAINARATFGRKVVYSTTTPGTRLRQYGPMRIPVTMYAVTFGSLRSFVILVSAKPNSSIIATVIIPTLAGEPL